MIISPKQVYVTRIQKDAIKYPKYSEALENLFEMGFVDYDINLALLRKYDGNIGAVAEQIIVHGTDGILMWR